MRARDPVWVFGYGSLVWRPAMAHGQRRAARIEGWARRFWQASTDHRGTPEAPGRVLTLVEAPTTLWGVAYAIDADAWPAIEPALEHREQQGYARLMVDAGLAAADRAGPVVETVRAHLYLATPANPYFIGPEDVAATAAIVRRAVGPSGGNVEYVVALARALAALGAGDPDVDVLVAALDAGAPDA